MSGGERNDHQTTAPPFDVRAPNDIGGRVVAALDEHIGMQRPNDRERRVLWEDDHGVDALERGEHVGAVRLRAHRPPRALETPHRVVAVEADDERVGGRPRGDEEIDVSRMQEVEYAVGERDAAGGGAPPRSIA